MFSKMFEGRHRGHGSREEGHRGHCRHESAFGDHSERYALRRDGRHRGEDRGEEGDERRGRGEGRRGGRGERGVHRLFEHGDLRRVLLALVAKKPSHGYELIKAIEEASSGLYVPSPGVIYPTLTLLEEQDFLEPVATGNGRKSYQITEAGKVELAQHQAVVDAIFARLAGAQRPRENNLAEGIHESMHRLRHALRGNMMRADLTPEQVVRVSAILQQAAESLEAEFGETKPDADKPKA
ncbi:PadR family transcriptional regulator [Rahnella aquatilis]|uniref:Putative transcriptional regulator n=1 Tax=Rahnella aquatilis (strain ATCC 33071 / DSM 4594 / JCM 1683 / NBRC 105701 / NCIMB 13365 / CIP 78.65) TaxID=745277 RepID=H2IX81_RAHAC|nr:PadR family transcriptional regulator [Rahnella aquatilis]AEX53017.1 putative transcriptional regulator [Rahnella aquatilis CIP 78.65 = ATCC 33071]KFD04665.1 PadR family transcriptional regulator [Rahnella aquatilis CIP 78.65 = ATCC 33071]